MAKIVIERNPLVEYSWNDKTEVAYMVFERPDPEGGDEPVVTYEDRHQPLKGPIDLPATKGKYWAELMFHLGTQTVAANKGRHANGK